ncbi:MAG: PSD1 and planctomycete cytochrome C domain-containing protein [Gemmataceae bacterium]
MRRLSSTLLVAAWLAVPAAQVRAADADPMGIEFFENKIRPVLVSKCYECHSAKSAKIKGGLLLDTREGIRQGGDNGPAVVPGSLDESLLIRALRHEQNLKMPSAKEKLSDEVIADFEAWIKMGAPDPRTGKAVTVKAIRIEDVRSFWAYKPVVQPQVPKVKNGAWARSDTDRFVLAGLEAKGLKPVADAERRQLARRLSFDLLGLPPEPELVEAFERDRSPQALETLVDKLLASPHFGERWGRHWLDVARYGESNGNADNNVFPHAWRYRDYVIAAFNSDKPYDRFITEQLAGDLLEAKGPAERDELLTATGFLALTSKPRAQNNPNYQMDLVADQIDVTTRGFLGLTVMCARCHDHKFDPVPTREYYALAGIFNSTSMLAGNNVRGNQKAKGVGPHHILSDKSLVMGVREGSVADVSICVRGESKDRGDLVPRGFLTAATLSSPPVINKSSSGRLELARWITAPENPLTARVAVNRMWQHLFGRGIVPTVDNFGSLGEEPTNQELLDHLALRFQANKWSVKKMIRELVLTRTYQLSTAHDEAAYKVDPDNTLLWRRTPHRLEAEAIRDAMLTVSGKLERTPPGRSFVAGPGNAKGNRRNPPEARETNHRSVYLPIVRNGLPEMLDLFDVADPSLVVGQRDATTVPAQALFLMNSPFVVLHSKYFAERLLALPNIEDAKRVEQAYLIALSRPPSVAERDRALAFIRETASVLNKKNDPSAAWASFCQALLASAEFRYLH